MADAAQQVTELGRGADTSSSAPLVAAKAPATKWARGWGADQRLLATHVGALVVYLVLTLLLGPVVSHPTTHLPDLGDSLHNIWTWGDNINRFGAAERGLFDANIYFPEKDAA